MHFTAFYRIFMQMTFTAIDNHLLYTVKRMPENKGVPRGILVRLFYFPEGMK